MVWPDGAATVAAEAGAGETNTSGATASKRPAAAPFSFENKCTGQWPVHKLRELITTSPILGNPRGGNPEETQI